MNALSQIRIWRIVENVACQCKRSSEPDARNVTSDTGTSLKQVLMWFQNVTCVSSYKKESKIYCIQINTKSRFISFSFLEIPVSRMVGESCIYQIK